MQIALIFIGAIVVVSLISRTLRSTELRAATVEFDDLALRFLTEAAATGELRIIANHPDDRTPREYLLKEREEREASNIPRGDPVLFLEVTVRRRLGVRAGDPGAGAVDRAGTGSCGQRAHRSRTRSRRCCSAIRDRTGCRPHVYFGWTEGNPLKYLARFILFGEGDIAPVTHEVLRRAEPDPERRPAIHVG